MTEVKKRKHVQAGDFARLRKELRDLHKALAKNLIPGSVLTVYTSTVVVRTAIG